MEIKIALIENWCLPPKTGNVWQNVISISNPKIFFASLKINFEKVCASIVLFSFSQICPNRIVQEN